MKKPFLYRQHRYIHGAILVTTDPDGTTSYEKRWPCSNWHCPEQFHTSIECPIRSDLPGFRQPPMSDSARVLAKVRRREARRIGREAPWVHQLRLAVFIIAVIVLLAMMLATN
ncbi:hypothetical protein [Nocardia sp. NPDC059195]|uniref:hypothetical protein n=1 Tax=Nocardia sp. NPDC059195 TaxID=3346765 RepID=UPI00368F5471